MINAQVGTPKLITSTGTVKATSGRVLGFYVASTTNGTIVLRDGGASGTAISGTITPAVGYHEFPGAFATDLHATIANTISVTFFVN
jgi:hypothetical protein